MPPEKRNYYTVKEVRALVFNDLLSLTTLHNLMKKGEIPYTNYCRKRLIPAWWAEQAIEAARKHD